MPANNEIVKARLERVSEFSDTNTKINTGVKKMKTADVKTKVATAERMRSKVRIAKPMLSKIPATLRDTIYIVKDDEKIAEQNKAVIRDNLDNRVKKSNKKVRVSLTLAEFNKLKTDYIDREIPIPQSVFDTFLLRNSPDSVSTTNEQDYYFGTGTDPDGPDLDLPGDAPVIPPAAPPAENGESSLTQEDVLKKLRQLVTEIKSPEYLPQLLSIINDDKLTKSTGNKRATEKDIETQITKMNLKGGPADEPAFYDFYNLQIAFEHVWKELFDNAVEDELNQLYQELVELEVEEPDLPKIDAQRPLAGFRAFIVGGFNMFRQDPPPVVLKAFSLSTEIWNSLGWEQQLELTGIATRIDQVNQKIMQVTTTYESFFDGNSKRIKRITGIQNAGSGYGNGQKVMITENSSGVPAFVKIEVSTDNLGKVTGYELLSKGIFNSSLDNSVPAEGGSGSGLVFAIETERFSYDTIEETRTLYLKAKSYFNDQRLTIPLKQQGENIIAYGLDKLKNKKTQYLTLHSILEQLEKRIKENYTFTIFAANEKQRSINFGIVINYRQQWTPVCYQAGEMVHTIALAPREVRKFSKKIVTKKTNSTKETASASEKKSLETTDNVKSEADIMSKAYKKVNANVTARASYSGIKWSFGAEASYGKESTNESADNRKDFREAVVKAAQEYKNERSLEISSTNSSEFEGLESGEISNPNDEIPVTYLFYELQQRYRINEKLHRITPVIMVANEVPNPNDIDEDWLIVNAWIIRQALLDSSFQPALFYLSNKIVGDEIALDELKKNMEIHRDLVRKTTHEYTSVREQLGSRYAALEKSIERRIESVDERREGIWEKIYEDILDQEDIAESVEVAKLREDASKDAYDRVAREEKEMRAALDREVTALQAATDSYTKMLAEHLNRKTEIGCLRNHVKNNILHYMQAIWSFEPADQRFLRLFKQEVPDIKGEKTYRFVEQQDPQAPDLTNSTYVFDVNFRSATDSSQGLQTRSLAELADLDSLMGFKGNYMVFPMKENNAITDYMMTPFLNRYNGLSEQETTADWTLEDYERFVQSLKNKVTQKYPELSREQFEQMKQPLRKLYKRIITSRFRQDEEIVVPTGSLFIEALPGKHPILEDFKLMHRAVDVKKAQAEVRMSEIENLRAGARLVNNELEDPKIEKKILIEGNGIQPNIPVDGN